MPAYEALRNKQTELIRKTVDGSVYVAPIAADPITTLTDADKLLTALPVDYDDIGWLSDDGAQYSTDVETSDVTSWGSVQPTRRDITSKTTTLQVACHETKKSTIGLYTGADMDAVLADATTGEVSVEEPDRPKARTYRVFTLGIDDGDAGEIYIARFQPRAQVTDFDDQAFQSGDDPLMWPVTLTGYFDSTLGFSQRYLFGGPGWSALLTKMGFESAAPAA